MVKRLFKNQQHFIGQTGYGEGFNAGRYLD